MAKRATQSIGSKKKKMLKRLDDLVTGTGGSRSNGTNAPDRPDGPSLNYLSKDDDTEWNPGKVCQDGNKSIDSEVEDSKKTDTIDPVISLFGKMYYILLLKLVNYIPANFKRRRIHFIRDILSANITKESIPEDQSLAEQITVAENFSFHNKEFIELVGLITQECLWKTTLQKGTPYNLFLSPPLDNCLLCGSILQAHHAPTPVVCYTLNGPLPALKLILRCEGCSINYRYEQYGNSKEGYKYYAKPQPMVHCSQLAYMDRNLCGNIGASGHHGWTSFESMAEVYNESMRVSKNSNFIKMIKYCHSNSIKLEEEIGDDNIKLNAAEIHRKIIAEGFWNYELEEEMREQGLDSYLFVQNSDREKAMNMIDKLRATKIYEHSNCSEECKLRGCGKLFSIDGNWKLCYPICMFRVPKEVSGFDGALQYVDSCPNQPIAGMAFCEKHCKMARSQGIACVLQEFRKGIQRSKEVSSSGEQLLTAGDCQGTSGTLSQFPKLAELDNCGEAQESATSCNKETGETKRMQRWTRGIWICASGGGHIQMWQPLYQSEGPAQVFLLTLTWLIAAFRGKSRHEWEETTLAYDNMCHLDNLKVAMQELPLPGDLKFIWKDITKIIDTLHIRNHKDDNCKRKYNPDVIKETNPSWNTMSCEQTFAWLSRFKRIVSSMPKVHFHFYIHRMIKRRNAYISYCYLHGRKPIQCKKPI